jgi:iron complex transport system substrate-binding protein
MEKIFQIVATRLENLEENKQKRAFWLFSKPNNVGGRKGTPQALFDLIKVKNLAPEDSDKYVELTLEEIYRQNPDLLFIWGHSSYSSSDLLDNRQWRHLMAIQNEDVYKVPAWSTFSPRLAPLSIWMAAKAYPDRFKDLDVQQIMNDFFLKVYNLKETHELFRHD